MLLALWANFKEDKDSWKASGAGEIIVNIVVLQFPPKLSLNKRVSKEFLYGIWAGVLFSVKAEITIPKQLKLLLIFLHSSSLFPEAPVTLTLSDPAKSTKFSLATLIYFPSLWVTFSLICSIVMIKTAWDLEESSFILVLAVALDLAPIFMSSIIYSGFTTAHYETPSTYTPFLASSLIWRLFFSCLRRSLMTSL